MRLLRLLWLSLALSLLWLATPLSSAAKKKTTAKPAPKTAAKSTSKSTARKTASSQKKTTATSGKRSARRRSRATAARRTYRATQQKPTPERYTEIQRALAEKGFFSGEPDGNWDESSVEALKRFQQEQNLKPDGKIGALSLIALGLGPRRGIAGAPAPPPQPSSDDTLSPPLPQVPDASAQPPAGTPR